MENLYYCWAYLSQEVGGQVFDQIFTATRCSLLSIKLILMVVLSHPPTINNFTDFLSIDLKLKNTTNVDNEAVK